MPLDLAHNVNPHGPAPAVLSTLAGLSAADLYEYPPNFTAGRPSALAERLAELCRTPVDRITLDVGGEGLLKGALHHLVRPGERVALPSAAWSHYRSLAVGVGADIVEYPVAPFGNEYIVDIDALLELADTGVRLLLLAGPANPTGNPFPLDRLPQVLAAFRESVVIYDEAYYGLGDHPPDIAALPALTERFPNLLVVRSFSKLYGMAGMRIGYGIAGDGLAGFRDRTARYLGYSRPAELAALAALDSPDHYDEVRRAMVAGRDLIHRSLDPFDGVTAYRSQANFVLVRLPGYAVGPVRASLSAAGVCVKWFAEPQFVDCARITLGTHDQTLTVLHALVSALSRARRHATPRRADLIPAYQMAAAVNGGRR